MPRNAQDSANLSHAQEFFPRGAEQLCLRALAALHETVRPPVRGLQGWLGLLGLLGSAWAGLGWLAFCSRLGFGLASAGFDFYGFLFQGFCLDLA